VITVEKLAFMIESSVASSSGTVTPKYLTGLSGHDKPSEEYDLCRIFLLLPM